MVKFDEESASKKVRFQRNFGICPRPLFVLKIMSQPECTHGETGLKPHKVIQSHFHKVRPEKEDDRRRLILNDFV